MRLRPDLYREPPVSQVDDVDLARSREYALLSALLRAPDADLLARLSRLGGNASRLGLAHVSLAEAASSAEATAVEREYFNLFIGLGAANCCRTPLISHRLPQMSRSRRLG